MQWWFATPNRCAAFLAVAVMLVCAFQDWADDPQKKTHPGLKITILMAGSGMLYSMAATYSRGGWLALCAGLIGVWTLTRHRVPGLYLALFASMIVLLPGGTARAAGMTQLSDGSILHRLFLWRGAAGMCAENAWLGLPLKTLGRFYTAWYQPLDIEAEYRTLLNDYLTVAGAGGFPVATFCLTAILFLLWSGVALARHNADSSTGLLAAYGSAALVAYAISALFNTFFLYPSVAWLPLGVAMCLLYLVVREHDSIRRPIFLLGMFTSFTLAMLVGLTVFLYGKSVNVNQPFKRHLLSMPDGTQTCYLQARQPIGTLICLMTSGPSFYHSPNFSADLSPGDSMEAIRCILRPAAEHGFDVFGTTVDGGLSGAEQIEELCLWLTTGRNGLRRAKPLVFLAWPEASVALLAAVASFPPEADIGIAAMNMPYSWPWRELSPEHLISQINAPLLLFTSANDDGYSSMDALRLRELAQRKGLGCRLHLIESKKGAPCRRLANLLPHLSWFAATIREPAVVPSPKTRQ